MLKYKFPLILFVFFTVFYAVQIPITTYKSDVITFTIRSLEEFPIIDFAYLNSQTLLEGNALPNYHIGHTVILWLAYYIIPSDSIWLAGFISAISAALSVVLTYLIWLNLGIAKRASMTIAIVFGFVPTFWEHATIGEIHALQVLSILLFIYFFLKDHYVLSTLAFILANLISPLSGLAFGLIFLKGFTKANFKYSIIIGLSSLFVYSIIYYIIGANLMQLLDPVSNQPSGRGVIYRIATLVVFILLNFNLFILYLFRGVGKVFREHKSLSFNLTIATIPQILLVFVSASFFIEFGSFQLLLFWALAFPLGYYLSNIKINSIYFVLPLIFTFAFTYFLWLNPHKTIGTSLDSAGKWLKNNNYQDVCIIGTWNTMNIIYSRNGCKLEYFNNYYYDKPKPSDIDLMRTKENNLIIAKQKSNSLRQILSETKIPGLILEDYSPLLSIKYGSVSKLYENNSIVLYKWEK